MSAYSRFDLPSDQDRTYGLREHLVTDHVGFQAPIMVIQTPSIAEQRAEFMALSEDERDEETKLHLAAIRAGSSIRPRFSDLLYAMGIVPD